MHKYIQAIRIGVIAVLLGAGIISHAQTITGNINGVVTDPSGAVIAGATVTATNQATNVQTVATTDKDGAYNIRFLTVGDYKVTFSAPGFGEQESQVFTLEVNQFALRNAKMSLASQSTHIEIQSEVAPLLNTENSTLATTLNSTAISNLPLVGRNIIQLTVNQPGAVSTQPANTTGGSTNQVSVNGNRDQSNNYSLDGLEMNQNLDNQPNYMPNPDALEQFQMVSANAPAEYGNVNGGNFVEVIKSGTNQFHGNAFFNLTNYLLNANTYANKRSLVPVARSPFTQDQFGGTIGGPILHNKLFFFGDYQGLRYHTTFPGLASVPDLLERGCAATATTCTGGTVSDLSELLQPAVMCNLPGKACTTTAGNQLTIQLYDPFNNFAPYANNQNIPIVNPVAKYLFAHPNLLPLPNRPISANDSPAYQNLAIVQSSKTTANQGDVKIDYKLTDRDNLSGRYSYANSVAYTSPALPINFPTKTPNPVNSGVLSEVHTFNSAIVNEFRAGITRQQSLGATTIDTSGVFGTNGNNILGIGSATGGIKQAFAGYSAQGCNPPTGSITGFRCGPESLGGTGNAGTNFSINTFLYSDTITWLKGKHSYKGGAQLIRYQQNNFYPGNDGSLGSLFYAGVFTGKPSLTATTSPNGTDFRGYGFADFVLDRVSYTAVGGVSGPAGMRQWRDAYFVQDDWKIRPNLTLNIGIRYEYDQQIYEVNNKYVSIDPVSQQPVIAGTAAAEAFCHGCSRSLVHPYYGGFMPRLGFSYSATPRLVVRGGYGIQNYMEGTGANLRMTTNPPFQSAFEANGAAPAANSAGSFLTAEQGFKSPVNAAPTGGVFNVWDPHVKPAFINQYSLTLEYQVSNTASFQVGYVGETGQHLITAGAANQLKAPCFINGAIVTTITTTTSGPCLTSAPAPYQNTPGVGYNGTIRYTASNAMENNNALQATFRQRAWHGLQYTVNYTWSHAMTNSIGFYGSSGVNVSSAYAENFYNNHAEYGPTGPDVRHNANWNLVYDLPLGRGKQFGANMPFFLDELVGGWKVAMTGLEMTGFPQTIGGATNNNYTKGNGGQRPNQYRKLKIVNRTAAAWYGNDPSTVACPTAGVDNGVCAYGQPAAGTYGTASPGTQRVPGYQQYNAMVTKDFTVWHEHKVNFRTDAVNVFNQSELSNPGNSPFGGTFGQITAVRSTNRQLQLTVGYHF